MASSENFSGLSSINATISISDDSSESGTEASGSASDTTVKHRNIATKKGTPPSQKMISHPQPQPPQGGKKVNPKGVAEGTQFLADFNPENSRREKNKRYNFSKPKPAVKKANNSMFDELGRLRMTREDACDCFELDCPGCHFPCEACQSPKCGVRCRMNRKWAFEVIEHDGKDVVKTNPLVTTINYRN